MWGVQIEVSMVSLSWVLPSQGGELALGPRAWVGMQSHGAWLGNRTEPQSAHLDGEQQGWIPFAASTPKEGDMGRGRHIPSKICAQGGEYVGFPLRKLN